MPDRHNQRQLLAIATRERKDPLARIELAPLLDLLHHLSSPAAKRDLLAATIEAIKADNIPDELQAAELEKLEARLAELR